MEYKMNYKRLIRTGIVIVIVLVCMVTSCAIGPIYSPVLTAEKTGQNIRDKTVVVTNFYEAQTELSYLGDLNISRILESARLSDISLNVSDYFAGKGIESYAMKDASVSGLKEGEVMLSGAIITKSIPMDENFPFPGMLIIILVGNILPSPAAYKSGVDVIYRYELVGSSGRILHTLEKSSRIFYKDYYIWGRIFGYKKYEKKIRDRLHDQIFGLIVDDLTE